MRYKVVASGNTQNMFISGGSVTGNTISNLNPSTTYNVRVAAVTDADTGEFSNINLIQTRGVYIFILVYVHSVGIVLHARTLCRYYQRCYILRLREYILSGSTHV